MLEVAVALADHEIACVARGDRRPLKVAADRDRHRVVLGPVYQQERHAQGQALHAASLARDLAAQLYDQGQDTALHTTAVKQLAIIGAESASRTAYSMTGGHSLYFDQPYTDNDNDIKELKVAGAWVFAGGLHPASTATVVRFHDGEVLMTDGPFAEGKEHIGGLVIINAPDLDAALEWGRKAARATTLPIEVRPFHHQSGG